MSGEAYMRLWKAEDIEELSHAGEEAEDACQRFRELGFPQVAADTEQLLTEVNEAKSRLDGKREELRRYWMALAWLDASDTNLPTFYKQMENGGK